MRASSCSIVSAALLVLVELLSVLRGVELLVLVELAAVELAVLLELARRCAAMARSCCAVAPIPARSSSAASASICSGEGLLAKKRSIRCGMSEGGASPSPAPRGCARGCARAGAFACTTA